MEKGKEMKIQPPYGKDALTDELDKRDVVDEFDHFAYATFCESYTTYDEIAEIRALLVHLLGVEEK